MTTKQTFSGGCCCGAVRYEFTAQRDELVMFKCHCRDCQRLSGGPYTPVVYIPATAGRLKIVCGQVKHHFTPSEMAGQHKRGFCADCGSRLTGGESAHGVAVTASSLDDPTVFRPVAEAWLCDAQPWDPPLPGLPRFDKYAPHKSAPDPSSLNHSKPLHAMNTQQPPADNEILLSRVLHAPRELVWEAWTNPKHVVNWWGPRGFTNTTKRHEFRVGGYWEHIMHGPDGTNYPNKAKFLEIVPLERITFLLGGGSDLEADERRGATFRATWTFETVEDNNTRLTGRMVFPSKEARDRVVRDFGAIEGGKQTLERAAEYVAGLQTEPFVISREFAAPRDLVWRVWTDPEHFKHWFGPKGFKPMNLAKMDLRPGGMLHYSMETPDGKVMWGRAVYREIVPPTRIAWLNSFSDAQGGITPHPFSKDPWPLQLLTVVTFAEKAGKTTVTVTWVPFDSTAAERATFHAGRGSMTMGWTGTFDQLAAYLVSHPQP